MTPETNFARFLKKHTNYTLKEIANKLGITQAALKSYELGGDNDLEMAFQVECNLPEILGLEYGLLPVQMFTDNTNSETWLSIINELIDIANSGAQTGYNTPLLTDREHERDLLIQDIVCNLLHCNLSFPDTVPQNFINFLNRQENNNMDDDTSELFFYEIENCETTHVLLTALKALTDISGYHYAYILPVENAVEPNNDNWEHLNDVCNNIEYSLPKLAFAQVASHKNPQHFNTVIDAVTKIAEELKSFTYPRNIPLERDPTFITTLSHDELGHMAEAKALGFFKNDYHPDYRINELHLHNAILEHKMSLLMKHLNVTDDDLIKIADEEE